MLSTFMNRFYINMFSVVHIPRGRVAGSHGNSMTTFTDCCLSSKVVLLFFNLGFLFSPRC